MRAVSTLLVLLLGACGTPDAAADARRSGQVRYEERTLEEWWARRRDPSDAASGEARVAIRNIGPEAVPFLAATAAGHDLGETIGGGTALEDLCPNALPAMEAARARYPSPALDAAIRIVKSGAGDLTPADRCTAGGDPVRPAEPQS
jgi:hypothetical protein